MFICQVKNLKLLNNFFRRFFLIFIFVFFLEWDICFAQQTIMQRILSSQFKNKTNTAQQFLYKYYVIYKRNKLPTDLKNLPPGKCGVSIVKELRQEAKKYKSLLQNDNNLKFLPANILSKPTDHGLNLKYETSHFVIWYTTTSDTNAVSKTDANANNIPDFVEDAGTYAEYSYNYFVNTLAYLPPPTTTNYSKTYIMIMDISAYGWTDYGHYADETGNTAQIAIHNTFNFVRANDDPEGKIKGAEKVTIAHELFHAVKASYDWDEDAAFGGYWWDEATSTWAEDIIYPQVNDYLGYLSNWFAAPDTPLTLFNGWHEYGTVIFAKFLSENHQYSSYNFGNKIIRESWEEAAKVSGGGSSLQNLKTIFSTKYNTTFKDVFLDFIAANYLKDYTDADNSKFPSITTTESNVQDVVPLTSSLNLTYLASEYYTLTSSDTTPYYFIFDGSENVLFSLVLIKEDISNTITKTSLPEANNFGGISLAGLNQTYNKATIIVANTSESGTGTYMYYGKNGTLPTAVSNIIITEGVNNLTLSWTEPVDENVISYAIYRSTQTTGGFTLLDVVPKGTATFTDNNLSSLTTYYYQICSRDYASVEICAVDKITNEPLKISGIPLSNNNKVEIQVAGSGIFPNPAKDKIYYQIKTNQPPLSVKFSVFTLTGNLVLQTNDSNPQLKMSGTKYLSEINFNNILPNGIYFFTTELNYANEKIRKTGKLVILK